MQPNDPTTPGKPDPSAPAPFPSGRGLTPVDVPKPVEPSAEDAPTPADEAPAPAEPTEGPQAVQGPDDVHRLTVGEGESLDYIADRENVDVQALYRANQPAIEAAAQARGFGGSDGGRLLFPGILLDLPS